MRKKKIEGRTVTAVFCPIFRALKKDGNISYRSNVTGSFDDDLILYFFIDSSTVRTKADVAE